MKYVLICFVFAELIFTTTLICLSRTYIKDCKAGMMIYFFTNFLNILISSSKAKTRTYFNLPILTISFCYTASSLLQMISFYMNISSVTFSNYYSLRVVIVSLISSFVLNKKYTIMQRSGKVLVILGVIIQFFADKSNSLKPYILFSIGSGAFNAVAAVIFEAKIKNRISDVFSYIFTYSFSYIPFNVIASIFEYNKYRYDFLFKHWIFYVLIVLHVISTYMSLFLSMSCDSFERTIISNVVGLLASLFSDLILLGKCDIFPLIGFTFVFVGIYLYINNKREEKQLENPELDVNLEVQ